MTNIYLIRTVLKEKPPDVPFRRLPYTIGTKEYEEDDYIGLRDPQPSAAAEPPPMQVEEVYNILQIMFHFSTICLIDFNYCRFFYLSNSSAFM
jgi:hypothetical protein